MSEFWYKKEQPDGTKSIYRLGTFYRTGKTPVSNDGQDHTGDTGIYLAADQYITPKVGAFLQYGAAQDDRNLLTRYAGAGATVKNFSKKRPFDTLGIAYASGVLNKYSRAAGLGRGEAVLEFYYVMQLTKTFDVMPDVQWVRRPGGTGRNNLVFGLESVYAF